MIATGVGERTTAPGLVNASVRFHPAAELNQ